MIKLLCSDQSHVLLSLPTLLVIALYKTCFPSTQMTRLVLPGMVERYSYKDPRQGIQSKKKWYIYIDFICLLTSIGGRGWSLICPLKLASTPSLCCPCIHPLKYFLCYFYKDTYSNIPPTEQFHTITFCFFFQRFVLCFSECLHAEYKSKGITVQVKKHFRILKESMWK